MSTAEDVNVGLCPACKLEAAFDGLVRASLLAAYDGLAGCDATASFAAVIGWAREVVESHDVLMVDASGDLVETLRRIEACTGSSLHRWEPV